MSCEVQKMRASQEAYLQSQDLAFGISFFFFFFLFVVNFVIHWNEKALGSHFWLNYRMFQTSLPDNSLLKTQALEHKLIQQVSVLSYLVHFVTPNCLDFNECKEDILCFWWHILNSVLTKPLLGTFLRVNNSNPVFGFSVSQTTLWWFLALCEKFVKMFEEFLLLPWNHWQPWLLLCLLISSA